MNGAVTSAHVVLTQFIPGPTDPVTIDGVITRFQNVTVHLEGDVTGIDPAITDEYGQKVYRIIGTPSPTSYISVADVEVQFFGVWYSSGTAEANLPVGARCAPKASQARSRRATGRWLR